MERYEVLAQKIVDEAHPIGDGKLIGHAFNLGGFGMIYRVVDVDTVALKVYVHGYKREYFNLRDRTLAECLRRAALFIKKHSLTASGTIHVCHRCLGYTDAFMQYNINDGKCFVCMSRGYYIKGKGN